MRIPEPKIDEIRSASDIVDLISSYVKLKKRGKNYLGLCPFHKEKTPSFSVNPEKQFYRCFGCGVGGNAFTFVMEYEKVSFVEAVRTLASRAGIVMPEEGSVDQEHATEIEQLYGVCAAVEKHFQANLLNTIEGQLALKYFYHRGFTDETIRKFGLGCSMNSWDDLVKHAADEKIPIDLLDKAGLIIKREDGSGQYDRFRGRAMFPIFSVTGRIIAFGARKLREDDPLGKYINSPETPLYNKSRVLYGLSHAKEAIREEEFAILVEGYADLISVYQAGIHNIVATSGTALTEEQIDLIGRYAKNITLVYDADSAGSKATMRGVDLIIERGLDVKVVELPAGDDPDSFVGKNGGEAFRTLVAGAVSFLDFKAGLFQSEGLLETPEGQTRAVRSIVETIARMKDELKQNFYIKHLSQRYGIYESVLFRELEQLLDRGKGRKKFVPREETIGTTESRDDKKPASIQAGPIPAPERDLLKLMLEHGTEMIGYIFSHIEVGQFSHPLGAKLVRILLDWIDIHDHFDLNKIIDDVEDVEIRRLIVDISFSKYELSKGWDKMDAMPEDYDPDVVAEQCLYLLRKREVDELISSNQREMKERQLLGEELRVYAERHQELITRKKELEASNKRQ